jgi:hypothetical protein
VGSDPLQIGDQALRLPHFKRLVRALVDAERKCQQPDLNGAPRERRSRRFLDSIGEEIAAVQQLLGPIMRGREAGLNFEPSVSLAIELYLRFPGPCPELCTNLGDEADQAALCGFVSMTSIPSRNLAPAMSFGN